MGDLEDRRERNFDVVSSVLGNNAFPFRVGGVLHVQLIMQTAGGLASQQVDYISLDWTRIAGRSRRGFERLGI